jgi:hypothetical protein
MDIRPGTVLARLDGSQRHVVRTRKIRSSERGLPPVVHYWFPGENGDLVCCTESEMDAWVNQKVKVRQQEEQITPSIFLRKDLKVGYDFRIAGETWVITKIRGKRVEIQNVEKPRIGHVFIETFLDKVNGFDSASIVLIEEVLAAAQGAVAKPKARRRKTVPLEVPTPTSPPVPSFTVEVGQIFHMRDKGEITEWKVIGVESEIISILSRDGSDRRNVSLRFLEGKIMKKA